MWGEGNPGLLTITGVWGNGLWSQRPKAGSSQALPQEAWGCFPAWKVQCCQDGPETGPDMQHRLQGNRGYWTNKALEAWKGVQGGAVAKTSA